MMSLITFSVCDSAKESCPIFPNAKNVIHHSFEDPSRSNYESDQEAMNMYTKTSMILHRGLTQ